MELRQSPRFPVQCPIAYSGNNIAGAGTVTNLSTGSSKVESDGSVRPRLPLLKLYCPFQSRVVFPALPDYLHAETSRSSGMLPGVEAVTS